VLKPMLILAIDPGTKQSGWMMLDDGKPTFFGTDGNAHVLNLIRDTCIQSFDLTIAIEKVESYGMAVGREVFETVHWSGRFHQMAASYSAHVLLIPRRQVKEAICHSPKANDATIRQALLDRFGGSEAKGAKSNPGPLYGVSGDVWSALALAITAQEHSTL
jgi:hypothetical protein